MPADFGTLRATGKVSRLDFPIFEFLHPNGTRALLTCRLVHHRAWDANILTLDLPKTETEAARTLALSDLRLALRKMFKPGSLSVFQGDELIFSEQYFQPDNGIVI
jgi:hypothetical protein